MAAEATGPPPAPGFKVLDCWHLALVLTFSGVGGYRVVDRAILSQARGQLLPVLGSGEALLGVEIPPGAQGSWCA